MMSKLPRLSEIESVLSKADLKSLQPVYLGGKHEVLIDAEKMFKTHVAILKANKGSLRHKPYYDRLMILYRAVQLKENLEL